MSRHHLYQHNKRFPLILHVLIATDPPAGFYNSTTVIWNLCPLVLSSFLSFLLPWFWVYYLSLVPYFSFLPSRFTSTPELKDIVYIQDRCLDLTDDPRTRLNHCPLPAARCPYVYVHRSVWLNPATMVISRAPRRDRLCNCVHISDSTGHIHSAGQAVSVGVLAFYLKREKYIETPGTWCPDRCTVQQTGRKEYSIKSGINRSVIELVTTKRKNWSVNQPIHPSKLKLINQSINQSISKIIIQSIDHSVDPAVNQETNRPIDQSIDRRRNVALSFFSEVFS